MNVVNMDGVENVVTPNVLAAVFLHRIVMETVVVTVMNAHAITTGMGMLVTNG